MGSGREVTSSGSIWEELIWQQHVRTAAAHVSKCHIRQNQYAECTFFFSVYLFFPVAQCSELYFMADWIAWELLRDQHSALGLLGRMCTGVNFSCPFTKRFGVCLAGKKLPGLPIPWEKMNNKAKELQVSSGQRQ